MVGCGSRVPLVSFLRHRSIQVAVFDHCPIYRCAYRNGTTANGGNFTKFIACQSVRGRLVRLRVEGDVFNRWLRHFYHRSILLMGQVSRCTSSHPTVVQVRVVRVRRASHYTHKAGISRRTRLLRVGCAPIEFYCVFFRRVTKVEHRHIPGLPPFKVVFPQVRRFRVFQFQNTGTSYLILGWIRFLLAVGG